MDGRTPSLGMHQVVTHRQEQKLEQRQQLRMTQELRQAIYLLQVPTLRLMEELRQEAEANPLLVVGDESLEEERLTLAEEKKELQDQELGEPLEVAEDSLVQADVPVEPVDEAFDWDSYFENGGGSVSDVDLREYHRGDTDYDPFMFIGSRINLLDHLRSQLGLLDLDGDERLIAEHIIGNLDDDGYLRVSVEELAQELEVDPAWVLRVLRKVQRLDPVGVAARSLSECFAIQLEEMGITEGVAHDLVQDLSLLETASRDPARVAKTLQVTTEEVEEALALIRRLNPKPGLKYSDSPDNVVVPEARVFKKGDKYVIEINNEHIPEVYVSKRYYDMLRKLKREGGDPKTIRYLEEKLGKALLMLRAVSTRKSTIRAILEYLLEVQREFFDKGPRYMKPLTRKEVATKIRRDESTVSRATAEKYVETPHGIIPFADFFPSAVKTRDGGEVSSTYVKALIQDMVAREDPANPLSDEEIAERLATQGIEVARRTVAKYRSELGILPSSKRRRR